MRCQETPNISSHIRCTFQDYMNGMISYTLWKIIAIFNLCYLCETRSNVNLGKHM
eukprot:c45387_g1_i1 orf=74-238(-)